MSHRITNDQHTGFQKLDIIKHEDEFSKPVLFETPKAEFVNSPNISNCERHQSEEKIGKSRSVLLSRRCNKRDRAD